MSIRIDEMSSDVELEPEPQPGGASQGGDAPADEIERLRRARANLAMMELRTRAEGYDD